MKTEPKTFAEEQHQIIRNEVILDADGEVIFEEVTCETSTHLPVLKIVDDDEVRLLAIA